MKILQIVKTSDGANWAYDQARYLRKKGVDIVTIAPSKDGPVIDKYRKSGMKVIIENLSLPIGNPLQFLKRKKRLQEIIKEEKPDIIHMHFVTNALFIRLALRGDKTPRLFQVPGPLHLQNIITRKIEILAAKKNDYWAPSCKYSKKIYSKYIEEDRLFLAYYGGAVQKKKIYKKTNKLRKEYKIANDTILIGMVSYFYKPKRLLGQSRGIKGHEDFIDAISYIKKENKNVKIQGIIIGGPWGESKKYENKVKKYARKKCGDSIIFTGHRNDIVDIYKDLDIVVHPSLSENLGGAAESLAAGVPTIATNIGGFPDIVIKKKTGLLCEPRNPRSIVNNINTMIDNKDLRENMAKNGQKLVNELLDINKTSDKMLEIYEKILTRVVK